MPLSPPVAPLGRLELVPLRLVGRVRDYGLHFAQAFIVSLQLRLDQVCFH